MSKTTNLYNRKADPQFSSSVFLTTEQLSKLYVTSLQHRSICHGTDKCSLPVTVDKISYKLY